MQDLRLKYLSGTIIDIYPYEVTDDVIRAAQSALGLVPSSAEGIGLERQQSNARMAMTRPLADVLSTLSVFASEAVTQYIVSQVDDPDAPVDKIREIMVPQNAQIIGIAVQSILAQLLESGVLEYKKA